MINSRTQLFIVIVFFACILQADDKGKSQTSSSYLWLGPGARATGMGNSFAGLADDAGAIYYNPAGIAQFRHNEMMIASSILGADRNYNYFSYVFSFQKKGKETDWYFENTSWEENKKSFFTKPENRFVSAGIALINFGINDIEGRDIFGNRQNNFSDSENTLLLSCALNIFENFYWGINIKVHNQDLGNASAAGYGIDTGFLMRNPQNNFSFGLCIQNIADNINWTVYNDILKKNDEYSEPVNLNLKLGSAFIPDSKKMVFLADIDYTSRQNIGWHIGSEIRALDMGVVRLGMDTGNPSFGLGLKVAKKSFNFFIDYSFVFDTEKLAHQHRFAFILK